MGILEEIKAELKALRSEVCELRGMVGGSSTMKSAYLLVADLATKYSVSTKTIDRMLIEMREAGFNVTVAQKKKKGVRMVEAEQFHNAYIELFANKEVA